MLSHLGSTIDAAFVSLSGIEMPQLSFRRPAARSTNYFPQLSCQRRARTSGTHGCSACWGPRAWPRPTRSGCALKSSITESTSLSLIGSANTKKKCTNLTENAQTNFQILNFQQNHENIFQKVTQNFRIWSDAKSTNRADHLEKMLQNAYLDASIGVDTEENRPSKVWGPKCGFGSWYM